MVFDLGGVILGSPIQAFHAYERELGLPKNYLNHRIVERGEQGAWQRLERGEIDLDGFIELFDREIGESGVTISTAVLMERVALISQPRESMLRAVERIRERGLRVAALTNNWVSDDQTSKMNGLRERFDVFVESAVEGLRKPDPRIYQLTCERLGVLPDVTCFLDDIGKNLKSARALGMATIKVDEPEQALGELRALLGFALD